MLWGVGNGGLGRFRAPEVFATGEPGLPNDLWALGIVAYMLLTAGHPFDDNGRADDAAIQTNVTSEPPNMDEWPAGASDEARHCVLSLLRKDPSKRLTIEQLLQHPWIVGKGGASAHSVAEAQERDEQTRRFREHTARLRAACFALMLQDVASERAALVRSDPNALQRKRSQQAGSAALRRHESMRGQMIEGDLLTRTFRVFDQVRMDACTTFHGARRCSARIRMHTRRHGCAYVGMLAHTWARMHIRRHACMRRHTPVVLGRAHWSSVEFDSRLHLRRGACGDPAGW